MVFEESFVICRPLKDVWSYLRNLDDATRCFPGFEEVEQLDDRTCIIDIKVILARFPFRFRLRMTIRKEIPPHYLESVVEGVESGKGGFVNQQNTMRLTALSAEETELTYRTEMNLAGRIAAFSQRIFEVKAHQLSKEFAETVQNRLEVHSAVDEDNRA